MIEAGAKEASEDIITRAIQFGHDANQAIIKLQEEIARACGKTKLPAPVTEANPALLQAVSKAIGGKIIPALSQKDKNSREDALLILRTELVASLREAYSEKDVLHALDDEI